MIRRPPRSTPLYSSAASDVYKRQVFVKNNGDDEFWIRGTSSSRKLSMREAIEYIKKQTSGEIRNPGADEEAGEEE